LVKFGFSRVSGESAFVNGADFRRECRVHEELSNEGSRKGAPRNVGRA
jgi:hypothetical protein